MGLWGTVEPNHGGFIMNRYKEPLNLKLKRGSLSRMLGIKEKDNIPLTLLRKITKTEIGMTIRNVVKTKWNK